MNDDLHARTVCRHRYPGGPHTIPTIIDLKLCKWFWPLARRVYDRIGWTPCRQARVLAAIGLPYYVAHVLLRSYQTGDMLFLIALPLAIIVPVFVYRTSQLMEEMHDRLGNAENQPTTEDVKLLYGLRSFRLVFVFIWLVPPWQLEGLIADLVFIVWPSYIFLLGGSPKWPMREKVAAAKQKLRALAASLRPRPALGGAGA